MRQWPVAAAAPRPAASILCERMRSGHCQHVCAVRAAFEPSRAPCSRRKSPHANSCQPGHRSTWARPAASVQRSTNARAPLAHVPIRHAPATVARSLQRARVHMRSVSSTCAHARGARRLADVAMQQQPRALPPVHTLLCRKCVGASCSCPTAAKLFSVQRSGEKSACGGSSAMQRAARLTTGRGRVQAGARRSAGCTSGTAASSRKGRAIDMERECASV